MDANDTQEYRHCGTASWQSRCSQLPAAMLVPGPSRNCFSTMSGEKTSRLYRCPPIASYALLHSLSSKQIFKATAHLVAEIAVPGAAI